MTSPTVGFTVQRESLEVAPASNAKMSVCGLAGPFATHAPYSDATFTETFPLDKTVLINSTDAKARMIDPDGQIGRALSLINAQFADGQTAALVVLVRTAVGADDAATLAAIAGNATAGTGIWAFKRAGAVCGVYPRLIATPGWTHQTATDEGGATLANPVAAALPALLASIYAIAYVWSGGVDADTSKDYRDTLSSGRLQVIDTGVVTTRSDGTTIDNDDPTPIALGLHVRRDFGADGRPFKSILNQPIYGIEGPSRSIDFSLLDGATEGQDLLSNRIAVIIRGESGDDFAVSDGGFVFMGFENVSDETVWSQTHKVRGRDFIELTAIRTVRQYLGKFNLTTQTCKTIIDTIDDILAIAEGKGEILGRKVRFDPDLNNESDLRTGLIWAEAKFEEAPVFRKLGLVSRPYAVALSKTIETLAAQSI